ncbi:FxsA family protein, partial [candidate division CSSED10-310 bacterium]
LPISRVSGFVDTMFLCILTGVVGGSIVRIQGLQTLKGIQESLSQGRAPTVEIVSGLMLLILGALLVVPGFITDVIGLLLLIPPLRLGIAQRLIQTFTKQFQLHTIQTVTDFKESSPYADDEVIDIEPLEQDED